MKPFLLLWAFLYSPPQLPIALPLLLFNKYLLLFAFRYYSW